MKNLQISAFVLAALQLTGCVGSTGGSFQVEEQFVYAGGAEQQSRKEAPEPTASIPDRDQAELLKVYDSLLSTEGLDSETEAALSQIGATQPESQTKLQKAILVLAASRQALLTKEGNELELDDSNRDYEQAAGPFEKKLNEYSLVLASELQTNSLLQTVQALRWIVAASRVGETESFSEQVETQLVALKDTWTQIIGESEVLEVDDDMAQAESEPTIPVPANYGSLEDGEAVLEKAEELAAEGKLLEAVRLLEALPEDSPFRETADEQIVEWSNKGVRQLRSLAAREFQKALPIANSQTKQEYLIAAKTHLEKARKDFPKSEQLQAVSENLKVIDQNLSALTQP